MLKKHVSQFLSYRKKIHRNLHYGLILNRAAKQFLNLPILHKPFFMIGIPGALHIMELSKRQLPANIDLVLVLNGMDEWEQIWAKDHFSYRAIITLDKNEMIPHSKVLDMLFDNYQAPFGILDYDCFVFNPECFSEMQNLDEKYLLNSLFFHESPILGRVPQTFFLFFNSNKVQFLKKKYKVDCGIVNFQKKIPLIAIKKLREIGIDKDHYPENIKQYFDTLILLVTLGHAENIVCNYLDQYTKGPFDDADVFHVGGVAFPNTTYGWWGVRGSYFWWRALENCKDEELRNHYYQKFGRRLSSEIFDRFPEFEKYVTREFYDFVERIVK